VRTIRRLEGEKATRHLFHERASRAGIDELEDSRRFSRSAKTDRCMLGIFKAAINVVLPKTIYKCQE